MISRLWPRRGPAAALAALALAMGAVAATAQESAMVRLLRSGKVPTDRQGTLIELIGKQGSPADLGFLLEQAAEPDGFTPENRALALAALANAASARGVTPEGDTGRIAALIAGDAAPGEPAARRAAIRLAGLWKVEAASGDLATIAGDPEADPETRSDAFGALANIGDREAVESLAAADRPAEVRMPAVAALASIDVDAAAALAVPALEEAVEVDDVAPLVDAFLARQVGPERLAASVRGGGLSADAAKLALRHMYAIGRTDAPLVAALSEAAGISAEPPPLTDAELQSLLAELKDHGDPARGEKVFRREDVNCMKCHAVAKAGGDIGPDLSAIGSSSPPDYMIRSVMNPEESVKEEYQLKTVLTLDGQIYQGIVREESGDRIVLKQADGTERVIPTDDVEDSKTGGSLMPKGLINFMTRDEFVDLVAFLSELGKPGPYAIRATPTIQRWRVLPLPEPDPSSAADVGDLPPEVVSAEPSDWQAAYGTVGGDLPLAELADRVDEPYAALRGEVDVTERGKIAFAVSGPEGIRVWLDGEHVEPPETFASELGLGRHTLTIRLPLAGVPADDIRVEVRRAENSKADFTVVGGP